MTARELDRLRAVAAGHPALRLLVLFGSRARGQAHPGSDWDSGTCPTRASTSARWELT